MSDQGLEDWQLRKRSRSQRSPRAGSLLVCVIVMAGVPSSHLFAQRDSDDASTICWPGEPLPLCEWFWLTEVGVRYRFASSATFSERAAVDHILEGGIMRNLTSRSSLGATVVFINPLNADRSRTGARIRYRHWLGAGVGLEAAAGALFEINDLPFRARLPGFSGQVALDMSDLVGVSAQVDVARGDFETQTDWFIGGRFGSRAGAVGGVVVGVLAAIALIVVLATFSQ